MMLLAVGACGGLRLNKRVFFEQARSSCYRYHSICTCHGGGEVKPPLKSMSRKLQNSDGFDISRYGLEQSDLDVMRKIPVEVLPEDSDVWTAYLMLSADRKRTYVGITRNVHRRLRQHNGELRGGSRAGRIGRPWKLICTVESFETRSEASQFEYQWKTITKVTALKNATMDEEEDSETVLNLTIIRRRQAALEEVLKRSSSWKDSLKVEWL